MSRIGVLVFVLLGSLSVGFWLYLSSETVENARVLKEQLFPVMSTSLPAELKVPDIFRVGTLNSFDMREITIDRLQQLYSNSSFTAYEYTEFCLNRIRIIDKYLESIMEVNPDALAIARSLDEERKSGKVRGPLHGVPVLLKDNMATKDGMETTAGSWALLGSIVPRDAHIVSLLRKAGAVILGKSNMSEWNALRTKNHSDGYSPRGGQPRNPFRLDSNPSGSSAGSAIAVSANIVPLAFGTETDTSIIAPAKINGVVGIKPTTGLTSRSGVVPISKTFDTVGSLGRTVADAVYGLEAIIGIDSSDDATSRQPVQKDFNYTKFLSSRHALKGAKFGLPVKLFFDVLPRQQQDVMRNVLDAMRKAGAEIFDVEIPSATDLIPPTGNFNWEHGSPSQSEFTIVKVDSYNGINSYLSELDRCQVKTLEDVVHFNEVNTGTEGAKPGDHPAFATGQDNFYEILETKGEEDDTYQAALEYLHEQSREKGIDAALQYEINGKAIQLEALLFLDRKGGGQQLAAQAGYPIITIPIGLDELGVPLGISLQHTAWQEGRLIKWASAVEDLLHHYSGWRPLPTYKLYWSKNIPINKVPK